MKLATREGRRSLALLPAAWLSCVGLLYVPVAAQTQPGGSNLPLPYPETPTVEVVDDYHGTLVPDPYRWLEEIDSPEVQAWVEQQNDLTRGFLEQMPARARFHARLTELRENVSYSAPTRAGGKYFYRRNDGVRDHAVLYWQNSLEAEPQVLIDPNTFSDDGTVALGSTSVSHDGRYIIYSKRRGGAGLHELFVREIETGRDLDDHLHGASPVFEWTHDGKGFFYPRWPEPEAGAGTAALRNDKFYYHYLGSRQEEDILIYERPDEPEWFFSPQMTEDGRYLVVQVMRGTDRTRIYYLDLTDPLAPDLNAEMVKLVDDFDARYRLVGSEGPILYFQTNLDAPRERIVAIDTRQPEREHWRTVIPEDEAVLASWTTMAGGRLVAGYHRNGQAQVRFFSLQGEPLGELQLPGPGSVLNFSGAHDHDEAFYEFTSYIHPPTIYRYDFEEERAEVFRESALDFDPSEYLSQLVFYESKDSTRVPLFVTHRRDSVLDGHRPVLLSAYGGFGALPRPRFTTNHAVWLEAGGVLAWAGIRGGGEYGADWHDAGRLQNRQNSLDDFIAAAEYLIREGYTSPERLAITGNSHGGMVVAAVANQRQDLFAAVVPEVGVMDMLRFPLYGSGPFWVSEYGSPDEPEAFRVLYAFSPYHSVRDGVCYPATLITTAENDTQVVPLHSYKYGAALQAAQGCDHPVLLRVQRQAGHAGTVGRRMAMEKQADVFGFLWWALGMETEASPFRPNRGRR
jgi:prolyl oligopeptidase